MGMLWVQYQVNTSCGALAVDAIWVCCCGCSTMLILVVWGLFCWVKYHVNASGGAVAVDALWVCCCGCSTSLIIVVALKRSLQCGFVVLGAVQ